MQKDFYKKGNISKIVSACFVCEKKLEAEAVEVPEKMMPAHKDPDSQKN